MKEVQTESSSFTASLDSQLWCNKHLISCNIANDELLHQKPESLSCTTDSSEGLTGRSPFPYVWNQTRLLSHAFPSPHLSSFSQILPSCNLVRNERNWPKRSDLSDAVWTFFKRSASREAEMFGKEPAKFFWPPGRLSCPVLRRCSDPVFTHGASRSDFQGPRECKSFLLLCDYQCLTSRALILYLLCSGL